MPRNLALGLLAALLAVSPLLAHHQWPIDRAREITLHGTVTAFTWANPHATIAMEVQANGTIEKWILGLSSPKMLSDNGWDKHRLKPGDVITAIGYRFTNRSTVAQVKKLVLADGRELYYAGPPRQ